MSSCLMMSGALLTGAANAAHVAPMSSEEKAALKQQGMGEFTMFCGDMPPEDGPETQACFQKHMSKLSPGRQGAIQSYKRGR